MYRHLLLQNEGSLAILTLNRPERRNALSLELMRELIDALEAVSADGSTRAVILAAAGKVFSSGHDLNELVNGTIADYRRIFDVCTQLMTKIQSIPQPVIAQVQGIATAAGCQLVATCDLAVASSEATFATPGVKNGLFCSTRVVAPAELEAETRKLACEISAASPLTISIGKQAYYAQIELDQARAYAYAKEVMSMNAAAYDAQEGITAFLEKRPACWKGK